MYTRGSEIEDIIIVRFKTDDIHLFNLYRLLLLEIKENMVIHIVFSFFFSIR